ncbi:MAG: thiol:disulfide interchange protein DsbA/DsbL [Pseudomonadota bacterium]
MLKRLLLCFPLMIAAWSCSASDEAAPLYVAGTNYDLITNKVARTAPRDKIEVAEFFWYGCGHCYTFEPLLETWKGSLPEDVAFRPIPAVWRDSMELHARAFYTAEALGVLDVMHPAIFKAMNVDGLPLDSQSDIARLFEANGVSQEDFNNTFNSFGVTSQVQQAIAALRSARVTGTPAMMVDGKYNISAQKAGSQSGMLRVADFLIEKERDAKAAEPAQEGS